MNSTEIIGFYLSPCGNGKIHADYMSKKRMKAIFDEHYYFVSEDIQRRINKYIKDNLK